MNKFDRNYELQIDLGREGKVSFKSPLTLEFSIIRSTLSSCNVGQFRIYNLSKQTRNLLRYNLYNYGFYRQVSLWIGYGTYLTKVFQGNLSQGMSYREGPDWITELNCFDGGFAFITASSELPFIKGQTKKQLYSKLIKDLPHVSEGGIGSFDETITRGAPYNGSTKEILDQETGGAFFVDLEKAYVLKNNEYVSDGIAPILINARSGILNTPILEQNVVRFEMLMEPQLRVGSDVRLDSITEDAYNGLYKVVELSHRGVISGSVCGNATTTGAFFFDKIDGLTKI